MVSVIAQVLYQGISMETVVKHSQRSEHLSVGFEPLETGDKGVLDMG